jgi:hypothetical protein
MSFKQDKDALYALQPTISGAEMGRMDEGRNSYYRGHLTEVWPGAWVAWVEYDHCSGPGLMRAAVTEHPVRRAVALDALNQRLRAKQFDNAGRSKSGNYVPLGEAATGEITDAQVSFHDYLNGQQAA